MKSTTKFWAAGLFLLLLGVAAALVVLPRITRARRAQQVAEMVKLARERLASGETGEATRLFASYLRQAPDDAGAQQQYAALLVAPALRPDASEAQRGEAVDAIRNAIVNHPKVLPLRRALAVALVQSRSFEEARKEIGGLRQLVAAAPAATLAANGIDPDELNLLEAQTCFANENIPEATALAAGLAGFDPTGRTFDPQRQVGKFFTDASLLLAAILGDKQQDPQAAMQAVQQLASRQRLAQRRLETKTEQLKRKRDTDVEAVERQLGAKVRQEQDRQKWLAVLLPPIPPLVVAFFVYFRRRALEREGVSKSRLR